MALSKQRNFGGDIKFVKAKNVEHRSREERTLGKDKLQILLKCLLDVYQKEQFTLLLMFDESHYLNFDEHVLAILKSHLKDQHVSTVFTGSKRRMLTQMFADTQSAYARRVKIIELENINYHVFQNYIGEAFSNSQKDISYEALQLMFNKVGLNPQRVQEIAHYVWKITDPEEQASVKTVLHAILLAINHNKPYFINEIKEMNDNAEYELKIAIAKNPVASLAPRKWITEMNIMTSRGHVIRKLEELYQNDEIVYTNQGHYCLRDPLFALWINESHAIG